MKKKILFVINTLGRAGAEKAMTELMRRLLAGYGDELSIYLYVLTGIGDLEDELPQGVKIAGSYRGGLSPLSAGGRKALLSLVLKRALFRARAARLFSYEMSAAVEMAKKHRILPDKLTWRILSDSAPVARTCFDLAIAFIEGGASYYVADHVNAKRKAAFIHIDYEKSGYTRALDHGCYSAFDRIFCVSSDVMKSFAAVYPEHEKKCSVFENLIDEEGIRKRAFEKGGFSDTDFEGQRILTVARLTKQKGLEVSIRAMKRLVAGHPALRWYILGEGSERSRLLELIRREGLEGSFILPGAVENPYPYIRQCDLYVHCTGFEGKSIAIREARILGKCVVVSKSPGNMDQVRDGIDGIVCDFDEKSMASRIGTLLDDKSLCESLGRAAASSNDSEDEQKNLRLIRDMASG